MNVSRIVLLSKSIDKIRAGVEVKRNRKKKEKDFTILEVTNES